MGELSYNAIIVILSTDTHGQSYQVIFMIISDQG